MDPFGSRCLLQSFRWRLAARKRMASRAARWRDFFRSDASGFLIAPAACLAVALEAYFRTDLSDADCSWQCQQRFTTCFITKYHVQQLENHGFVVFEGQDAAVRGHILDAVRAEVDTYAGDGRFSQNPNTRNGGDVRQDQVSWLRETDGTLAASAREREWKPLGWAMMHCVQLLRGVAFALEVNGYASSKEHRVPKQMQLGWYPGDWKSGYAKHFDCSTKSMSELGALEWLRSKDYRERVLTVILYLNDPCWRPLHVSDMTHRLNMNDERGDGGELRVYHCDGGQETYTDVIPRGGTLIIFDSRRIEHEVLPSRQDRFALTCWINGKVAVASV